MNITHQIGTLAGTPLSTSSATESSSAAVNAAACMEIIITDTESTVPNPGTGSNGAEITTDGSLQISDSFICGASRASVPPPSPAAVSAPTVPPPRRHLAFAAMQPPFVNSGDYHRFAPPGASRADDSEWLIVRAPVSSLIIMLCTYNWRRKSSRV
ncbi:hypothetical protein M5689_024448 [Euphorbia peplus]|nr:hypothetical protein M5689_024448 [Euphorbia peplus]